MLKRIPDQVFEDPLDHPDISFDKGKIRRKFPLDPETFPPGFNLEFLDDVRYEFDRGEHLFIGNGFERIKFGKLKELFHQNGQSLALACGDLNIPFSFLGRESVTFIQKGVEPLERGQRRPEAVGYVGQHGAPETVELLRRLIWSRIRPDIRENISLSRSISSLCFLLLTSGKWISSEKSLF
jgi:hypothetical protein